MAKVNQGRWTAEIEGDFVVFLIGTRLNSPRQALRWFFDIGGRRGMPHMLKHLMQHPEKGLLGFKNFGLTNVQYWRSFEHLERYARSHEGQHWPAWVAFNKRVRVASGDVGIWHETYRVRAGEYEAIYGAMPRMGLAMAGNYVPIGAAKDSARARLATKD